MDLPQKSLQPPSSTTSMQPSFSVQQTVGSKRPVSNMQTRSLTKQLKSTHTHDTLSTSQQLQTSCTQQASTSNANTPSTIGMQPSSSTAAGLTTSCLPADGHTQAVAPKTSNLVSAADAAALQPAGASTGADQANTAQALLQRLMQSLAKAQQDPSQAEQTVQTLQSGGLAKLLSAVDDHHLTPTHATQTGIDPVMGNPRNNQMHPQPTSSPTHVAQAESGSKPNCSTTWEDEMAALTTKVLHEWRQLNPDVILAFDTKELQSLLVKGEFIVGVGPTQGHKTVMVIAAAVLCALAGIPCALIMCECIGTTCDLVNKLQSYFRGVNKTPTMQEKGLELEAKYVGNPGTFMQAIMGQNFRRVQSGQTVLVVSYQAGQIDTLKGIVQMINKRPQLILDEADLSFSSPPAPTDDPKQPQLIKREVAFYELVHCLDTDDGSNKRFPGIFGMLSISATPLDVLGYFMKKGIPVHCVLLDREELSRKGYVGPSDFKPLEVNGKPVFLGKQDVLKKNQYGLQPQAGKATPVRDFYDAIKAAHDAGQKALLAIDISNSRVIAECNTMDRAKTLAGMYPFTFLVINGKGVYEVESSCNAADDGAVKQKAVFSKSLRQFSPRLQQRLAQVDATADDEDDEVDNVQDEVKKTLREVLMQYDSQLDKPIVIIGYGMMRRSLTAGTPHRVCTHMFCAPNLAGISFAEVMQMLGRAMGINRAVLERHGHKHVTVLTYEHDFKAMQLYYEFCDYLYMERAKGTLPDLYRTLEDVPAKFRTVLNHSRRQGQQRLGTTSTIRSTLRFATDQDASGASSKHVAKAVEVKLGIMQHMSIMLIAAVSKQLGLAQVTSAQLRLHAKEVSERLEENHRNGIYVLRKKGYVTFDAKGVYGLTPHGQQYVDYWSAEEDAH